MDKLFHWLIKNTALEEDHRYGRNNEISSVKIANASSFGIQLLTMSKNVEQQVVNLLPGIFFCPF
ncbi:MAG: hypothetical protein ABF449_05175 [Ethanoligenens sp.]